MTKFTALIAVTALAISTSQAFAQPTNSMATAVSKGSAQANEIKPPRINDLKAARSLEIERAQLYREQADKLAKCLETVKTDSALWSCQTAYRNTLGEWHLKQMAQGKYAAAYAQVPVPSSAAKAPAGKPAGK